MIEILSDAFAENPHKTAYISGSEKITYSELWELAQRYAFSLRGSKNPVLVKGEKEIHMPAAFLACIMASRPYVPCDTSLPEARIKKITELSGADTVIDSSTIPSTEKLTVFENNDSDIAYIIFTSGSTGEPKGVPISRGNLKSFIKKLLLNTDSLNICKGKTVLNQAKFSFDLSVADIYFSLCTCSTLYALTSHEQKDPQMMIDAMTESKASLAVMTPTFAKYCLCMPEFNRHNLNELKTIFFCGETLEPQTVKKLFDRFPEIRIINAYGPTEATCAVCCAEITRDMCMSDILPVGTTDNSTCTITVKDNEILLSGDSVFLGYLGKDRLIPPYHTGDRGKIENGYIYCLGRMHGYIKYKGHRIEPDEIKSALYSIDGVEQCAVRIIKNTSDTVTGITAAVVSSTLEENKIKERLSKILPDYMIPKTISVSRKIGLNENGKQNI